MRTYREAKAMAKAMREALAEKHVEISHSYALEIVARQFGLASWNILSAKIDAEAEQTIFRLTAPIVRIFDEERARDFYLGFLGFTVDWEHRFHPGAPLYMQLSRGALVLHLSEHSGDASPGCTTVVYTSGVEALQKSLIARNYKYNRPGLERQEWGLECEVIDPFGNRIRFIERRDG